MGFEIKNICTIVPNPYHPLYTRGTDADKKFFYFSLFITPRLQFDGKLKEFYEMRHWPHYAEKIFWNTPTGQEGIVSCCFISSESEKAPIERDHFKLRELMAGMNILDTRKPLDISHVHAFLDKARSTWYKLFNDEVPVEAWPIYLKPPKPSGFDPQIEKLQVRADQLTDRFRKQIENLKRENPIKFDSIPTDPIQFSNLYVASGMISLLIGNEKTLATAAQQTSAALNTTREKASSLKKERAKEQAALTKFRQEFHKKVSALARYPHLLRLLGFIQDFKVDSREKLFSDLGQPGQDKGIRFNVDSERVKAAFANGDPEYPADEFLRSVQFVNPYTRCEIHNKTLRSHFVTPTSVADQVLYEKQEIPDYSNYVLDGFLRVKNGNNKKGHVFSIDQDYFEDRPDAFSDAAAAADKDPNVVGVNTKIFSKNDLERLSQKVQNAPKITKGFSIKIHSQPGDILTNMEKFLGKNTDKGIESPQHGFMAHHLDCGYRVDVDVQVSGKSTGFRSLCHRQADYVVDTKKKKFQLGSKTVQYNFSDTPLFNELRDEPWLEEVRLMDQEGSSNRFEEIARWNGWSLSCPPLYANKSAPNSEADDMELRNIYPIDLPNLRFGANYTYSFRIRTVDICGNGPELRNSNHFPEECIFRTEHYKRKELLGSPLLFPPYALIDFIDDEDNANKKINRLYKSEENDTLVIRSTINRNGSHVLINQECVRYITPPYVPMHFAEISGTLDPWFAAARQSDGELKSLYEYLGKTPKYFYKAQEIENRQIPFLFDAKIQCLEIIGDHKILAPAFYADGESQVIKKATSIKLVLRDNDHYEIGFFSLAGDQSLVEVRAAPGTNKRYKIRCNSNDGEAAPSATKDIEVIHAVQKPFFIKMDLPVQNGEISLKEVLEFQKNAPVSNFKDGQQYEVFIQRKAPLQDRGNVLPFSTTSELNLIAMYNDYVLNPASPRGWSFISKSKPSKKGDLYQEGISAINDKDADGLIKDADKFFIRKSWSNLDEETPEKLDTILEDAYVLSKLADDVADRGVQRFKHTFPDTKFRRAVYKVEAVSKYSGYFDAEHHFRGDDQIKTQDNPFSIFATFEEQIIKNSAKPSKPEITSIIPIFTTAVTGDSYNFEHNAFRIYLGKTWFETGLEEKLCVVYKNVNPTEEENKGTISVIANDPTTDSLAVLPDSSVHFAPYTDSTKKYIGSAVEKDSISISLLSATLDSIATTSNPVAVNADYGFSTFQVQWDPVKGEFFAEVSVSEAHLDHYSTFLKFAVCRYQQHSILQKGLYDYRFSDVVMTDMVSILPARKITTLDSGRTVTIEGKRGHRYGLDETKKLVLRPNKIFLVAEHSSSLEDGISEIDTGKRAVADAPGDATYLGKVTLDDKNKTYFIEEYEDISLNDAFKVANESDHDKDALHHYTSYNPRNDPRKRLVFFYRLSN